MHSEVIAQKMFPHQEFDEEVFLECIKELIRLDKDWVPKIEGTSLYVRPTFIGTEVSCGRGVGMGRKGSDCEM